MSRANPTRTQDHPLRMSHNDPATVLASRSRGSTLAIIAAITLTACGNENAAMFCYGIEP